MRTADIAPSAFVMEAAGAIHDLRGDGVDEGGPVDPAGAEGGVVIPELIPHLAEDEHAEAVVVEAVHVGVGVGVVPDPREAEDDRERGTAGVGLEIGCQTGAEAVGPVVDVEAFRHAAVARPWGELLTDGAYVGHGTGIEGVV